MGFDNVLTGKLNLRFILPSSQVLLPLVDAMVNVARYLFVAELKVGLVKVIWHVCELALNPTSSKRKINAFFIREIMV